MPRQFGSTDIQTRFSDADESYARGHTPPYPLRRQRSTTIDIAADVSKEVWLITRLAAQLLWALRTSQKWVIMTIRLLTFVALLFPAFLQILWYWLFHPQVHKNIPYGYKGRNLLDVYTVAASQEGKKRPVLVFFSGGAWIIGYKAWGALMGKFLANCGVVFVTPDYRNFPQGMVPDMLEDASLAMQWVFTNIEHFGGDPDNVTLMGQSAGAHIAACMLIDQVMKEGSGQALCWRASRLRSFIGISGPYNIRQQITAFHRRGLDESITERIMDYDIPEHSPTIKMLRQDLCNQVHVTSCFPPVTLFHGTSDQTVSWKSTEGFAEALEHAGVRVETKFYEGKSHTDPIIEDPITGDDPLLQDILSVVSKYTPPKSPGPEIAVEYEAPKKMLPLVIVKLARYVNPF